ncbi:MAG: tRNA (adenosine(37)-N6)-dimethylallyltransferase MiaA [Lachnospiraceae bacterium]|nr:tRNA (adenosine(37)-N6)-dimethylallyltransferase MiaA [Lachnospiraceae bacterium]
MKKKLIVVAGPTASGKSTLAVSLCQKLGGSVISCDSMQVYKNLDIGSAKITPEEMGGVRHYLIDVADPKDPFYVARFQALANEALSDIYSRNELPVLCGGTGFYINSVLYNTDFTEEGKDESLRQKLSEFASEHGNHALHEKLKDIDPVSYETIHENNIKRVIRAIEYYEHTGEPISAHNEAERKKESPYDFVFFLLTDDRQKLYARIDRRVDAMVSAGLYDEVKRLYDLGLRQNDISMQGISYRQFMDCIEGKATFAETVERIKLESRHYAKRQMTWFRRQEGAIVLNRTACGGTDEGVLDAALRIISERGFCD